MWQRFATWAPRGVSSLSEKCRQAPGPSWLPAVCGHPAATQVGTHLIGGDVCTLGKRPIWRNAVLRTLILGQAKIKLPKHRIIHSHDAWLGNTSPKNSYWHLGSWSRLLLPLGSSSPYPDFSLGHDEGHGIYSLCWVYGTSLTVGIYHLWGLIHRVGAPRNQSCSLCPGCAISYCVTESFHPVSS